MRSYRLARNTLVLLASAIALSSAGTAFGGEPSKSKLPVVINNVHVPLGEEFVTIGGTTYNLGISNNPWGVVVNPATNLVYTSELSGGGAFTPATSTTISVIDGNVTDHTWNKIVKNIETSKDPNLGTSFLAVNTKTNKIYADLSTAGWYYPGIQAYLLVIDGNTNKVMKEITVNPVVTGVAVNESTNKIYIANYFADTVQVIDGDADKIIKTISIHTPQDLNNPYEELGVPAVSEKLNRIYVPNYLDGSVTVIDGATDTIITSEADLTACPKVDGYPSCLPITAGVNDRTGKVSIVREDNNISVLDAKTYKEITVIPLSPKSTVHPYGIDIDKDANILYVADASGFVDVVDGNKNALIGTVPVGLPPLNGGEFGPPPHGDSAVATFLRSPQTPSLRGDVRERRARGAEDLWRRPRSLGREQRGRRQVDNSSAHHTV
jgi:DNA-binding beta-propeller fold protein YncE